MISEAAASRRLRETASTRRHLPGYSGRLLCEAYPIYRDEGWCIPPQSARMLRPSRGGGDSTNFASVGIVSVLSSDNLFAIQDAAVSFLQEISIVGR